jgi:hypothetical protein
MIEPEAVSGARCRSLERSDIKPVHPLEETTMARQSKTMQRREALALEQRSGRRPAPGAALSVVALQAVTGGGGVSNDIIPTPDPPVPSPVVRG